jgi:predicted metalloprotease with PDZ domain
MTNKKLVTEFPVCYQVWIEDAAAHIFRVRLTLSDAKKYQLLQLPDWIPGSYMIRDFARNIVSISAKDSSGSDLEIKKLSKSKWQVLNTPGLISVDILVYAWDLSVRGAHLDQTHAFFNGTSLFLEPVELSDSPCALMIYRPAFEYAKKWSIATSMPEYSDSKVNPIDDNLWGYYCCEDYSSLIDHPVEIAELTTCEFDVKGVPHQVALYGKHNADLDRLAADLKKICEWQINLFGELPGCVKKYVFLVTVLGNGYGGLEHRSSTALHCSRQDLPTANMTKMTDDYIGFLTLCSHEYFHTWNIKQIKPEAFMPYGLQSESYTQQLWIFEGFTSYYEDRVAYMSGVIDQKQYLQLVSEIVTRVHRGSGRLLQSAAESSFDAWTRFYKQDQNAPNAIVSYYAKGKLIALCLDILIRQASNNKHCLDHVMQYLWNNYGVKQIGLKEQALEQIITDEFGLDLKQFFNDAVYSTKELPLENCLKLAGVNLEWYTTSSYKNMTAKEPGSDVNLAATVKSNPLGAELVSVYHGGTAHLAGLSTGDIVIAIDGIKVDAASIESCISQYKVADEITIHAFRRDELMVHNVKLPPAEKNTCQLIASDSLESAQVKWL